MPENGGLSQKVRAVLARALASSDAANTLADAIDAILLSDNVVQGNNEYTGSNIHQGTEDFNRVLFLQGTLLEPSDFALSPEFGSDASVTVGDGSTDSKFTVTVTSAGTGQAAYPSVTLTFKDGAFDSQPAAVAVRCGGSQRSVQVEVTAVAPEAVVLTLLGTPVSGQSYKFTCFVRG